MVENFKSLKFKFYPFLDNALNEIIDNLSKELDDLELFFNEHYQETRHRLFYILSFFFVVTSFTLYNVKTLVKILESPVADIQFFQLSPGEYFVSTIVMSLYTGVLFATPLIIIQTIFFRPALTKNEKNIILFILTGCIVLFFLGLFFSYFLLVPAALNFFLIYGSDVVEPLWSFTQYFSFVSTLFVSAGLVFQVPIIQIMLSVSRIIDPVENVKLLATYDTSFCTILGAILTPSADPITQLLLSSALFLLYFLGSITSINIIHKNL